ncbi:hypothetical protein AC629_39230 [Bradyrhizobium sp. NAS80.1]|nr:hypothetical protein AC629_39230 [Bradyrhizobium sp. NAS80.1]
MIAASVLFARADGRFDALRSNNLSSTDMFLTFGAQTQLTKNGKLRPTDSIKIPSQCALRPKASRKIQCLDEQSEDTFLSSK